MKGKEDNKRMKGEVHPIGLRSPCLVNRRMKVRQKVSQKVSANRRDDLTGSKSQHNKVKRER